MSLNDLLKTQHPIIVAPMFLISNADMVVEACENGATAAIPALNYRSLDELKNAILEIRARTDKPFGINLIVNQSNLKYASQLELLLEYPPDFIITSLGNPKETIEKCKPRGIKIFCDVVDAHYAKKVADLGADAVIAVNNKAGGHCGNLSQAELIQSIQKITDIPIISAGGIANSYAVKKALDMGAIGVSVGTIFLAAKEAQISDDYRSALIQYGEKDIVLTTKISGSHLTVINTPYVQSVGTKASLWEKFLLKNKRLKKYIKMLMAWRGMKEVENAVHNPTYKTVWCAGPSIEHIHAIRPLRDILNDLIKH